MLFIKIFNFNKINLLQLFCPFSDRFLPTFNLENAVIDGGLLYHDDESKQKSKH
jgi:hypothetical protein